MIETVLGPIPVDALGPASFHDHVLSDASSLQRSGAQPAPDDDRVGPASREYLRTNMLALADNLRLDDPDLSVRELQPALAAGQQALVEATSWGLGPDHAGLPDLSRRSGMTIVCSYGAYIPRTLPPARSALSEAEWERDFFAALVEGVPGTDFRAGILGIMGTTGDLPPIERAILRAAARAAVRAGASVSIRLDPDRLRGIEVLAVCAAEGLPADRVVFTNADEYPDAFAWEEYAGAGAVLEMCFGTEDSHGGRVANVTDAERLEFFLTFCAAHPASRHVLGQSVWTKRQLRAHGGNGYAHLFSSIVPALRAGGVGAERVDEMLIGEPRRLLDRGE